MYINYLIFLTLTALCISESCINPNLGGLFRSLFWGGGEGQITLSKTR